MKKLLLILLCLPLLFTTCKKEEDNNTPTNNTGNHNGQTYVPDDNFEQSLINLGYDNVLDNYVITSSIDTVTVLEVYQQNISDLTGIEDFTALTVLDCEDNQLTSLDVSQNTALTVLSTEVNQLTSLDLSNNTALTDLWCYSNQLTTLDVSNNTALILLSCGNNQLTSLDLRNGNNTNMTTTWVANNPNLTCINVDDAAWSTANWVVSNMHFDPQHYFSEQCP